MKLNGLCEFCSPDVVLWTVEGNVKFLGLKLTTGLIFDHLPPILTAYVPRVCIT